MGRRKGGEEKGKEREETSPPPPVTHARVGERRGETMEGRKREEGEERDEEECGRERQVETEEISSSSSSSSLLRVHTYVEGSKSRDGKISIARSREGDVGYFEMMICKKIMI